jgi:hypothetical protein
VLTAVEMALRMNDIPHARGGVDAAMDYLAGVIRRHASQFHPSMAFAALYPSYGADLWMG